MILFKKSIASIDAAPPLIEYIIASYADSKSLAWLVIYNLVFNRIQVIFDDKKCVHDSFRIAIALIRFWEIC